MARLTVKSDIAGKVWKIEARPGQAVAADETLIILESMKMEIPVAAPRSATLVELKIEEGETVAEGQVLAVLEG